MKLVRIMKKSSRDTNEEGRKSFLVFSTTEMGSCDILVSYQMSLTLLGSRMV